MKTRLLILIVAPLFGAGIATAAPMGTAFTYQGLATDNGLPATGLYDVQCLLYDAPTNGVQIGPTQNLPGSTTDNNGVFTVPLDFGAGAFNGQAHWLEWRVRTNGSSGSYTVLLPRQELTPAPSSLFALNAATLGGQTPGAFAPASGSTTYLTKSGDTMTGFLHLPYDGLTAGGNQLVLSAGNVGIGTVSPQAKLHVAGAIMADELNLGYGYAYSSVFALGSDGAGNLELGNSLGNGTTPYIDFHYGFGANQDYNVRLVNYADGRLRCLGDFSVSGTVGIGTGSPAKALEVRREMLIKGNDDGGTEYSDWPNPSLSIRRSDNFTANGVTMLSLGYRNDPLYTTGDSVANIRLWDPNQSLNAATSTSTTQLRIASPGPLVLQPNGGNVGIGTASPAAALDVVGSYGAIKATSASGNAVDAKTIGGEGCAAITGDASTNTNVRNYGGSFSASGGNGVGVYGLSYGLKGIGVWGDAPSGGEDSAGGYFEALGYWSKGVYGRSPQGYGVFGDGDQGIGVKGRAGSLGVGVEGEGGDYDFWATGPGVDYGHTSSIRWKRDIRLIDDPLAKLTALRGVYFNWDTEHGGGHDVGMIAEEVGEVLPEIVGYEANGIDATGMDYSMLTPLLVEAGKALKTQVDELRQQLAEKEARVGALESDVAKLKASLAILLDQKQGVVK